MFWICRNRKVVTLKRKKKKTQKLVSRLWQETTLGLQRGDEESVHPAEGQPSTQTEWSTEAVWTEGWGAEPAGCRGACCCLLGTPSITPARVWDNLSVPCSSPHVLSFVEQWCLRWTCFLVLHLVKNFFLYFCWRLNICINCKYIWFITVKALVPISGFSFSFFIIFIKALGSLMWVL